MRTLQGFRYFFAIRPDPRWYPLFQEVCRALGLPARLDRLHVTFCVVAERSERDHFLLPRARRALQGARLQSAPVSLGRVRAGRTGAVAHALGRQDEIQDLYDALVRLLRTCGIQPMHRKSGFHPHVTLGYRACRAALLQVAIRWVPTELLLIESEIGLTRHNVLERWPLLPPRQPLLPFDTGPPPGAGGCAATAGDRSRRWRRGEGMERVKGIEPSS